MHPSNIRALLIAITYAGATLSSCADAEKKAGTTSGKARVVRYIPGGDDHEVSPLALLMRQMTVFTDSTGKRLSADGELPPYPAAFKGILTAEPTPGMVDHATFDPFAFAWLQQLDSLYRTPAADRGEVFNGLVQRCADCHGEVCPGPLDRIHKLRVRATEPSDAGSPH